MMVTEIAKDGNLRQYLSRNDWDQVRGRAFLNDVATGMAYLHSIGILHGDLKSANVVIDGNKALVCDFGLSKVLVNKNTTVAAFTNNPGNNPGMIGTLGFIAPELMSGEQVRPPADVFAYAMTCYEVVSKGKYPFEDAPSMMAVSLTEARQLTPKITENCPLSCQIFYLCAVEKKRPDRPEGVPDQLWALMTRAWAHVPESRPKFDEIRDGTDRYALGP